MYHAIKIDNNLAFVCKTGFIGRVHSIFDKVINVHIMKENLTSTLITLARSDVYENPFTLITSMPENKSWKFIGIEINDKVLLKSNTIYIGDSITIHEISKAKVWYPLSYYQIANLPQLSLEKMRNNCTLVTEYIKNKGNNYGTYPLIIKLSDILDGTLVNLEDIFLNRFLQGVLMFKKQPIYAPKMLLGLGDGLTPSGDDFLAGFLFAIQFAQIIYNRRYTFLPCIIKTIQENMDEYTNEISRHFLRYSFKGMWGKITQDFMVAMFTKKELQSAVQKKLLIGATSGMDEMFGIMYGFCEIITLFETKNL